MASVRVAVQSRLLRSRCVWRKVHRSTVIAKPNPISLMSLELVASAGYGLDHTVAVDIFDTVRSRNGLTVAIVLKPFNFEGLRRQEEVKALLGKLKANTDLLIEIDIDALLKKDLLTLDEAMKTTNDAVLLAIKAIFILKSILECYKEAEIGFGAAYNIGTSILNSIFDCPFLGVRLKDPNSIVICILASSVPINDSDIAAFVRTFRQTTEYKRDIILSTVHEPNAEPNQLITTVLTLGFWERHNQQQIATKKENAVSPHEVTDSNDIDEGATRIASDLIDENPSMDYEELEPAVSSSSNSELPASRGSEKSEDLFDSMAKYSIHYDSINEGVAVDDYAFQRERLENWNLGPGYEVAKEWAQERAADATPVVDKISIFHLPVGVRPSEEFKDYSKDPFMRKQHEPEIDNDAKVPTTNGGMSSWSTVTDAGLEAVMEFAYSLLKGNNANKPKKHGVLSVRAASMLEAERDLPKKWSPVVEMPYRGGRYKGRCQGGLPEGKGWFYFHTGDRWFANFWKGKANGEGRFYTKSGDAFFGNFKDGWRHSQFLCINSNGTRPTGPPPGQPPSFASRPSPNVAAPFSGVPPPGGSLPNRPLVASPPTMGARPGPTPFNSSPISTPPVMPPTSAPSHFMNNGPPAFSGGALPGPQRFPAQQPIGPPTMRAPPGPAVQPQPPYPMPSQGAMQPPASPFGAPWQMQSQQVAPPPPVPVPSAPRMFHMPPALPNQSMSTTISTAVGQTGAPMTGHSKIDPNQIPRPSPGSAVILHDTRQGNQATIPPVVDFGESGPVRCSRCKAYINPFMKFVDQGRRFICNLCGFSDETPREYHCNLGPDGRRRDADERPELCRGVVEFVATKEFMEGPRTMVGIATFDSTIHFYNLKRALQQPLMLIIPDVQDVYTPLQTDVIVPLSECHQHLELLLESIPTLFQNSRTSESAFGAAIKAAFLALKDSGGKLLVFQSVLPSIGIGALSAREAEGRTNISAGEKEANKLLQPADKAFMELAVEFAEYQVCVDVFVTTQTYVDIASISVIPRTTGGQVYYYCPFSALSDPAKLYNDLRWNITRPQGFEAVMRVRCSQCISFNYYGMFNFNLWPNFSFVQIDCDKTFMVTLKHDDKLQDGSECAFQCALLYTTVNGERRIRVITLSLPVTSMLSNLFRAADLDTQFCCFLKQGWRHPVHFLEHVYKCIQLKFLDERILTASLLSVAANEVPSRPLPLVREKVTNLCINALFSYRKYCATVSSSGQLILPEALKLLPLYTLALTKSTGLRTEGKIDEFSFWLNYVSSLSTQLAIPLVYPRMVAIHDLDSKEDEESVIPSFLPLSSEHVSDDGVYLLENGHDCLIYIGDSVSPDIVRRLFGVATVEEIPLLQYDNSLSKKLNEVVNEIRRQRCSYLRKAFIERKNVFAENLPNWQCTLKTIFFD
ncbi:hypothetical protein TanjilG_11511 [Lupinus angustifolius]|uniref:Uncharacterized protein n=1 Tax=Lupinus angustifolius TaxID=3871 RepID=A0A1J7HK37_LUPAN|nr:hypothetical protein TanjilG_11511 [Lupinus angustifolius]